MTKKDHYFTILNEEAGEIIQASCKCLRFSETDGYPNTDRTNISDLSKEINDLLGVIELLQEEGVAFKNLFNREQIEAKKSKVKIWLEHSKKMGRIHL